MRRTRLSTGPRRRFPFTAGLAAGLDLSRHRGENKAAMDFFNVYEDAKRAESYSRLEFPGTYYLAFRDLPAIIAAHVKGKRAVDFGCGAGRSTRFLKKLGFDAIGIDVSADMLKRAWEIDPEGDYRLIDDAEFGQIGTASFDLVLSAFTFDNIPTRNAKVTALRGLAGLLAAGGAIVNLVSSPDIYTHEWASFTTKDFPENKRAKSGDKVRIVMTDVADRRPVEDVLWSDEAYRDVYRAAGLEVAAKHAPLGREDEPYAWVSETRIAPWVIYVLKKTTQERRGQPTT
jgi:SAM-dependent methyltransferase